MGGYESAQISRAFPRRNVSPVCLAPVPPPVVSGAKCSEAAFGFPQAASNPTKVVENEIRSEGSLRIILEDDELEGAARGHGYFARMIFRLTISNAIVGQIPFELFRTEAHIVPATNIHRAAAFDDLHGGPTLPGRARSQLAAGGPELF